MARGHQNLIWTRTRQANALRSALRECYPGALGKFPDLADRDCLAVMAKAPTPAAGAGLTLGQIRAGLKRGGRQRNLDRRANGTSPLTIASGKKRAVLARHVRNRRLGPPPYDHNERRPSRLTSCGPDVSRPRRPAHIPRPSAASLAASAR